MGVARYSRLAVAVMAISGPAFAGESLYPPLEQRASMLTETPANDFTFEAEHLLPAPDLPFKPLETPYEMEKLQPADPPAREAFLNHALDSTQRAALAAANAATDPAGAYRQGEGLPESLRLYTAGAVAFDQHWDSLDWFQRCADMQDDGAAYRVWAEFMLGRAYAAVGDFKAARLAFQSVRDRVKAGAADPLGLAVASYGYEAKTWFDLVDTTNPDDPAQHGERMDDLEEAARLYALQASFGSDNGAQSLRILAASLEANPPDMDALLNDPPIQKLMLDYALAPSIETGHDETPDQRFAMTAAALEAHHAQPADFLDRVALEKDRLGHADEAQTVAGRSDTALALWLKASLATRAGHLDDARALLDQALAQAEKPGDLSLDNDNRLRTARATSSLAGGDFTDALTRYLAIYDRTASYIVERILTPQEAIAYVDEHVPAPAKLQPNESDMDVVARTAAAIDLRNTLARRLVRLGRIHDALRYFQPDDQIAHDYAAALDHAAAATGQIDKAAALYDAAVLEREHGDGILGRSYPDEDGGSVTAAAAPELAVYATDNERRRFDASSRESPVGDSYRRIGAERLGQVADLLPAKSQAYAAVLCEATHWTSPFDDSTGNEYYQRYVKTGAVVPWATHFGHGCPAPDFREARHFATRQAIHAILKTGHRHAMALAAATMVGLEAGFLFLRRRRTLRARSTA